MSDEYQFGKKISGLPAHGTIVLDETLFEIEQTNLDAGGRSRQLQLDELRDAIATTSATDDTSGRLLRIDDYLDRAGDSDSAWTVVTSLDNGWTGTVRYIKRAGMVTVSVILNGSGHTEDTVRTLPAGYRPQYTIYAAGVQVSGTDEICRLAINSGTGEILVIGDGSDGSAISASITYPVIP